MIRTAARLSLLCALALLGCDSDRRAPAASPKPSVTPQPASSASAAPPPAEDRSAFALPAVPRLIALGDLHGDLAATRAALRLAGAIDDKDHWIGGTLTLVQNGDQVDRGDHDRAILDLFERLAEEARAAGGAVHALNGNHELMNAQGDLRYVTEGAFRDFEGIGGLDLSHPRLSMMPPMARARAAAFMPGGPYARKIADRKVILMVGDTVFVHAGVLPAHVRYGIGKMNRETSAWLEGQSASPPAAVLAEDGPVWTRRYGGKDLGPDDCEVLGRALEGLGAKRMVIGHTVHKEGIAPGCDGRVWRVDVGMSAYYGGRPAVLEIAGETVTPIKSP
ncbi:metallophosphoesterase [Chondromyces crocatus]|uniref:Metallophosphatase n=1 Tax=Chondromyces crocatus TaxID=52 RepID=A0A0K1EAH2_CHOCO|nr:metallophosphoesterase [Chondromyces crocatus]AKT37875.1 metallophosphatase [Chondromyces crocatus]